MAGVPVLAAVSAPSTLATDLAVEAGMTLVGFLRGASMNVYAGAERVRGPATPEATDKPGEITGPGNATAPPTAAEPGVGAGRARAAETAAGTTATCDPIHRAEAAC
jgi:FdhD protein